MEIVYQERDTTARSSGSWFITVGPMPSLGLQGREVPVSEARGPVAEVV